MDLFPRGHTTYTVSFQLTQSTEIIAGWSDGIKFFLIDYLSGSTAIGKDKTQ